MTQSDDLKSLWELSGKIDLILENLKRDSAARKVQYEKQNETDKTVHALTEKVDDILDRLKAVEVSAAEREMEINRWIERGKGVLMFLTFVSAAFGAFISSQWNKLLQFFSG